MANIIQHKRSSTSGVAPAASGLSQGELAINIADGKLYTKNSADAVINLGVTSISGTYITPSSGNFFNYLAVNGVPVSVSGHSHTTVQQSESLVTTVFNETGSTISKMTAVYINGGHGDRPTIQKAIATSDATSAGTYGLVYADIDHNQEGQIIVFGSLSGVNTDPAHGGIAGATEGSVLYLSPTTSGAITTTKPYAPDHVVAIGTVVRVHQNEGIIEVRVQNGFELDELHNVAISGVTNGQFLQYNNTNGLWVPSSSGNFSSLTINNNQIVTGTGVANHIAYWNSTSGIVADSGQLYWDSTNNRLGIGTSSPSNKLEIAGGDVLIGPTDNTRKLIFFSDAYGIKCESGLEIFTGDRIRFRKGGVEYARIESDGKVGIGTSSPVELLTVYGDSKYLYLQAQNNTGAAGIKFGNTAARQQMYIEGTSCDLVIDSMNGGVTESIRIGYNTGAVTINESGSDLDFRVEGDTDTNLVFVDASTDRVGIGTSTPGAKLDINGNVNIDGNLTFDSFTESVVTIGSSSTSQTLSLTSGTVQTCTLTGNCTFTMPTATAGKSFSLFLNTGTGGYSATFTGVRWSDSTPPTITSTASKVDLLSFISDGTYWYGSFSQNYG